jgi:GNAT superfamily N-acetyltransferase
MEWRKEDYLISNDSKLLDTEKVLDLLSKSYWATERANQTVLESIKNSICFGVYHKGELIGFARAVTDKAVFTWIADVIIHECYRGKGLGTWLVECIVSHPDIKNTKQRLATKDAHGLYEKFGFKREECMARKSF